MMTKDEAKNRWIAAQRLDVSSPFGTGADATRLVVEHLGYVQIDTIHVIERCHHHILYNRIPDYHPSDLQKAQSQEKSVFEYWTHALSYVPTRDYRFFMKDMNRIRKSPGQWLAGVKKEEMQKVLRLIRKDGALSIRDIEDDVLVEKSHPWASKKPSKKALQLGFYDGTLTISERIGMLKKYELSTRHFAWKEKPKAASEKEILEYLLDRALRTQAVVSLDSICHLDAKRKPLIHALIESQIKRGKLVPVKIEDAEKVGHWAKPEMLETASVPSHELVHLLSPFDPLIIQRKRLELFFDYEHRFEAYLPKEKRMYGYFALPVLLGNEIVAAIDLKTDREKKKLLIQKWTWLPKSRSPERKRLIESELHRFEKFQLRQ